MGNIKITGYLGNITLMFPNGEIRTDIHNVKFLNDDFIAIQKSENSKWSILDKCNNEMNSFYEIEKFSGGHFKVQREADEPFVYLDLAGRISSKPTQSGRDFYAYYKTKFSYQDLNKAYFADKRFLHAVVIEELNRTFGRYQMKFIDPGEQAQRQLEINEAINDWVYQTSNVDQSL